MTDKIKCQECGQPLKTDPIKSGVYVCIDCLLKESEIIKEIRKERVLIENILKPKKNKWKTNFLKQESIEGTLKIPSKQS